MNDAKAERTLRDAFAVFGARAVNPRWAWAAQSDDGATVVLTMWTDQTSNNGGVLVYDGRAKTPESLAIWKNRHGNQDRLRKLIHARDHCGGRFRVVKVAVLCSNHTKRGG